MVSRYGRYEFDSLHGAWQRRGKNLGFDTGGEWTSSPIPPHTASRPTPRTPHPPPSYPSLSNPGLNVDTLIHLGLDPQLRLPLLTQFLSLPVGRDMMLWNIIVGHPCGT